MNTKRNKSIDEILILVFKKFLLISLIFVTVFLSSCSKQDSQAGGFSLPPMPVEVAEVKVQKVADQFEAIGTIEAIESISVVSEIDAAVVKLPFEEGSFVEKR